MAKYDLTKTISPYLDRHLVFPLLEFLDVKKDIYPEEDLLRSKLQLLDKTNMVDFAMDIYKKLHKTEDVPQEMKAHREDVVARLKQLQAECTPILRVLDNQPLVKQLRQEKLFTLAFLQENHGVTPESVDALYRFAKFQFECGNYSGAAEYLFQFRALNTNAEKNFSALWGKFAAEILMQNWEDALKDMNYLKDLIDSKNFTSPLKQLQQRTWLIHWSLFVFFNHPNGRNGIIDLFFSERYLNAIQTTCPHILRYLTTAVITNKRRRNVLKDLVKVIQQECYTYKDPITEFLEALYVNFDFEESQVKLRECEKVLVNDFFLVACRDEFIENARMFIFETYCRIHQCIDIGMLGEKLNMDAESAERWIVNLIRNARLDAKIDSKNNTVIMGSQYPSVYQRVIEKTKGLTFRSQLLANNLTKATTAATPATAAAGSGPRFVDDEEGQQTQSEANFS
jgi:translation initiation factor 3 subunit E